MSAKKVKKRKKIALKLSMYMACSLLAISMIIGIVFTLFFWRYSKGVYINDMRKAASSISEMVGSITEKNGKIILGGGSDASGRPDGGFDGRGTDFRISKETFTQFLSGLSNSTAWLVAPNESGDGYDMLMFVRSGQYSDSNYDHLTDEQKKAVETVFEGNSIYTSCFGNIMEESTLTVGEPIKTRSGRILGVVLVHSSWNGLNHVIWNGISVMIMSIVLSLLVGFVYAMIFGRKFSKPLRAVNNAASLISEGNYDAKTNVTTNDEIGMLAETIDSMGEKLRSASEEQEKLEQTRRTFIANISHELRTPVTVIRGSLEAINDGVITDPETVDSYHKELLKESIYMQRLVNDILDLSRLQNNDFSINITEFNLFDCISDAVRGGRRLADSKGIAVNFEYDTVDFRYSGDYDRIRQMLLIVLDNAIKFTSDTTQCVTVSFMRGKVSVVNTGQGISEEDLPYIFERFYRSRSETNKEGTGLGLAITKQIAIRHNIAIHVRSRENGETVFTFDFNAGK